MTRRPLSVLIASLFGVGVGFAPATSPIPGAGIGTERPSSERFTLTVIVEGVTTTGGRLGTALFTSAAGFPDAPVPLSLMHPHTTAAVDTFVFRDLAPGRYAVAVQHDLNGNGVVDRNLVGLPKEPWGVSRNVRHTFRAPRFDEAAVELRADTAIRVRVAR